MRNLLKQEGILISVIYFLAHGLMLTNNGIYWDDWTLFNVDAVVIIDTFKQNGVSWLGYFHPWLLSFDNGIFLYRAIAFMAYLITAFLLNGILKTVPTIERLDRILIVTIFAVFPVNSARIALIDVPYSLVLLAFFIGFYLISKYVGNRNPVYRILSWPFFLFSFTTNSFLVFFAIVLLYVIYRLGKTLDLRMILGTLVVNIDLVMLPVLFWIIKLVYLKPYGTYQGYNQIKMSNLLAAPFASLAVFYTSFIEVLNTAFQSFHILIAFAALLASWVYAQNYCGKDHPRAPKLWLLFGLFAFWLAAFPYMAVGKLPGLEDWASRHQLLLPLGAAFMLYYGLKVLYNRYAINTSIQLFSFFFLIFTFVAVNVSYYIDFQKDWYKQLSMVEQFKKSPEIRTGTTFLFKDATYGLNANNREYRFYEYSGLMKYAAGGEARFGYDYYKFRGIELYTKNFNKLYNLSEYRSKEPEYLVVVRNGDYPLTIKTTMTLWFNEKYRPDLFKRQLADIVSLAFVPVQK